MFHVNPLTWAFRAAVLNEFQSPAYDRVCLPEVAEGEECPKEQKLGQVSIGMEVGRGGDGAWRSVAWCMNDGAQGMQQPLVPFKIMISR